MKTPIPLSLAVVLVAFGTATLQGASSYRLVPITTFGINGDGTILPNDQPWVDTGFNQRGLACDPLTTNLVFVDTHSGSGGSPALLGAIYVLDGTSGAVVPVTPDFPYGLNTNGINGGSYATSPAGVAEDGVVYVANQVTVSTTLPVTIYRWDSTTTTNPPTVAFTGLLAPTERYGVSMDVRGSGTNTQIIMGSSSQSGATGTNVVIFTTADGTNFTATVLATDATGFNFIEGIAFGAGNTFWAKAIGVQLRLMSFNLATSNAVTLRNYFSSELVGSENWGPISVDTNRNLLATIEEAGGVVGGGPERVWLYDISNTNKFVLLDIKDYAPNNQNATAPPGYLDFCNGRLYTHVLNNGLVAYNVESGALSPPVVVRAPAPTNRVVVGQSVAFSVLAYPAVSYQWQSNGVDITGATNPVFNLFNCITNYSATYGCVVTNAAGSTNVLADLSVVSGGDLFHLNLLWRVGAAEGQPWMNSSGGAGTPNQRTIGYNALSNQVYVISRSSGTSSNYVIHVLNATNGAFLYTLKTNGVLPGIGNGGIGLVGIGVAEDGAIYACNVAPNAYGTSGADPTAFFRIYRWADSGSNTLPVQIFQGEPTGQGAVLRWGDSFCVRGGGTNTQILIDCNTRLAANTARYAAILYPTDTNLTTWASEWILGANSGTAIGKSAQFDGNNNVIWQKVAQGSLIKTSFDPTTIITPGGSPQIGATVLGTFGNFSNRLCGVGLDLSRHLAAGVNVPTPGVPDSLDLYDISNPDAPLLLAQYNFPPNPHNANNNFISQTFFAGDKLFTLDGNNGIMVFTVASGPVSPPQFVIQPQNLRLILGGTGTMTAGTLESASLQWQKNNGVTFTNIPGQTNGSLTIVNAQLSDGSTYRVVASTVFSGSTTSSVATVTVSLPQDNYSLSPIWSAAPGTQPYATGNGGGTPNERSMAYNSLSNHLYIIHRSSPGTSNYVIFVLNASDGSIVSALNTNGIYNAGAVGEGGVGLVGIGVAGDGAIYACNMAPDACGCGPNGTPDSLFRVYRWADGDSNTVPVEVFQGDPAGLTSATRWGDNLSVRGVGTNTEILLDTQQGNYGAVLRPTDQYLTNFASQSFTSLSQSTTIGRSLEFGSTNTLWQKRVGTPLRISSYDLSGHTSSGLANYSSFLATLGPVALDFSRNILVGIDFKGTAGISPDAVDLYEISSLNTPMLLAQYNFATNQLANGNFIGQVVFAGNRVFALDGNNGLLAFNINGPSLKITPMGSSVVVSWPLFAGFTLQATPSINPPATWTNVGSGTVVGGQYVLTNPAPTGTLFYRLAK